MTLNLNFLVVRPSIIGCLAVEAPTFKQTEGVGMRLGIQTGAEERQHRHLSQLLRVGCKRKREILFGYSKYDNKSVMHACGELTRTLHALGKV